MCNSRSTARAVFSSGSEFWIFGSSDDLICASWVTLWRTSWQKNGVDWLADWKQTRLLFPAKATVRRPNATAL